MYGEEQTENCEVKESSKQSIYSQLLGEIALQLESIDIKTKELQTHITSDEKTEGSIKTPLESEMFQILEYAIKINESLRV